MFAMFFLLVSCMAGVIINHSSSYLIPFIVVLIFVAFSFQVRRRQITRARAHLRGEAWRHRSGRRSQVLLKQEMITQEFLRETSVDKKVITVGSPGQIWSDWCDPWQPKNVRRVLQGNDRDRQVASWIDGLLRCFGSSQEDANASEKKLALNARGSSTASVLRTGGPSNAGSPESGSRLRVTFEQPCAPAAGDVACADSGAGATSCAPHTPCASGAPSSALHAIQGGSKRDLASAPSALV